MVELKTYEASINLMVYGIEKMLQVLKKFSISFNMFIHITCLYLFNFPQRTKIGSSMRKPRIS